MKPYHHPRFILYHALTVGLGIAFAAGLLLAVAGFVGLVPPAQAQQQVSPPPIQSMLTAGPCGQQGTLPSRVAQGTLLHGALYLIGSRYNGAQPPRRY